MEVQKTPRGFAGLSLRYQKLTTMPVISLTALFSIWSLSMTQVSLSITAAFFFTLSGAAFAQDYNAVPAGDSQYRECLVRVNKIYEGGNEKSPIRGQNKAQAYCTCLWNETPDDFRGNLSKFADSDRGKRIDKICTKYSDWE